MAKKEVRKIKVYEQNGRNYNPPPTIMLKGLWLEEMGFEAGMLLTVVRKGSWSLFRGSRWIILMRLRNNS